ncbi:hypothetical protein K490DRAFT_22563, partial [Saccharata proteae CBS 121410]
PETTMLRLVLQPWVIHFKMPGYMKPSTMEVLDGKCKDTLKRTKDVDVRRSIGTNPNVWQDLCDLLENAVPSLEKRSFAPSDPTTPEYEGASGTLIAQNYATLMKDLERLNDVVSIGRNALTVGQAAQDLAAKHHFDQEIFKLINVCVKVTARGFDGDAGTSDEEKWQNVVNSYKKLLITCLQFLNNLVSRNERRKLMLWIELFDTSPDGPLRQYPRSPIAPPDVWASAREGLEALTTPGGVPLIGKLPPPVTQQPASSALMMYIGKIGMDVRRDLVARGEKAGATEVATECKRRWEALSQEQRDEWQSMYADLLAKHRAELNSSNVDKTASDQSAKNEEDVAALAASINQLQLEVDRMKKAIVSPSKLPAQAAQQSFPSADLLKSYPSVPMPDMHNYVPTTAETPEPPAAMDADFRMTYTADYGASILKNGKDDLIKRLGEYPATQPEPVTEVSPSSPVVSPASPNATEPAEDIGEEVSEEEDSDDEDYVVPGDDGRGLLTDVPLILGPSEIEVLPMIIMSGIVPSEPGQPGYGSTPEDVAAMKNMHTVRCHLLLAQDNGRNLLRELLIFVAAWDLREEELYFKFMVKIMEAILTNGLMPFSYHAFRDYREKDIISPAQAVIMKLLTNIFKARQTLAQHAAADSGNGLRDAVPPYPLRVDVHMVNFLFTEFRRHIIPQTCALIFLQGQIRVGFAHPEDFPLNLWDMERMYEGVYQYLEFFAILTEHEVWKKMMADWEITSELVTLLKELDAAIPKGQFMARRPNIPDLRTATQAPATAPPPAPPARSESPAPVAVERPYDVHAPAITSSLPADFSIPHVSSTPYVDDPADEPSDFEWRNLKKLTVLVLTSLVWKSRKVQDQVRSHGGIEAMLNCCAYDEHNPYIKEHAIMCLRFLLEGNAENQALIKKLEPKGLVPNEVLDSHGYETFWDNRGQVGLRRKDGAAGLPASSPSPGPRPPKGMASEPPNLEVLMQQVMRDLPARVAGARMDAEKAAALAKLDKHGGGPGGFGKG